MKTKCSILFLCLLCTGVCFAQKDLFDQYANKENVTSVYVSKTMFDMMPAIGDIGLSLVNMKGKVESLQIVSTEQPGLMQQMRKDFSQLVSGRHQELMRVRDGKTRATFYADMKGEQVRDLLMLADTDSSFTVIQLLGNFSLKDIQNIAGDMQISK
ncbi:MAG: DUF4252 domain-containing protein [Tannerellaceae bacterium]|jgi:hypothetical protein|nr:DUF4252 domain-containing protein [Tannerellaceae bacterium]